MASCSPLSEAQREDGLLCPGTKAGRAALHRNKSHTAGRLWLLVLPEHTLLQPLGHSLVPTHPVRLPCSTALFSRHHMPFP